MKVAEFPVTKLQAWISEAENAFESEDFGVAWTLAEQVIDEGEMAFEANRLIEETNNWISGAKEKRLFVEDTEIALNLAVKAFEREDFKESLERAKEAQLIYILETKGKINILWFLGEYWWAIITSLILLSIASFLLYKQFIVAIINQRMRDLSKEEVSLNSLIKDVQYKHLKEGTISSA